MTAIHRGRLLLVSPAFHGYWRPIADAFTRLGWEVITHRYDAADTFTAKANVKLRAELPLCLGRGDPGIVARQQSLAARAAVHTAQPDRVLVIKGDTLTEPFWDALDRPRVPRTLWLYDELRRTRHTPESIARFDSIASYSHHDVSALQAAGRPASFVPLAFDELAQVTPLHVNAITFIGARYPKRESLVLALHEAGIPVRAYGRDWSGHYADRLRTWRLRSHPFDAERDIDTAQAHAVMAGSPGTLNIHGDQDGFTMRTFEAAGVGGVQLIDRTDVDEFYEPGREVAVFESVDELCDLARRAIADDAWGDALRVAARSRTLAEHTFTHRARQLEATWA